MEINFSETTLPCRYCKSTNKLGFSLKTTNSPVFNIYLCVDCFVKGFDKILGKEPTIDSSKDVIAYYDDNIPIELKISLKDVLGENK